LSSPEVKDGKRWTATRKVEVVLAVLKGANASEVCWKNGISQSQAYAWRDSFLEGGQESLKCRRGRKGSEGVGGQPVGA
jgi:transposase-like protein